MKRIVVAMSVLLATAALALAQAEVQVVAGPGSGGAQVAATQAPPTVFQQAQQEQEIMRQRAVAKVFEQLVSTESAVAARRFVDAQFTLEAAARLLATDRNMSESERQTLTAEIGRVRTQFEACRAEYLAGLEARESQQIAQREQQRIATQALFTQRQQEDKWSRLKQFREQQNLEAAQSEARAILATDPTNAQARRQSGDLDFFIALREKLAVRTDRLTESGRAVVDTEASSVPYTDPLRYPSPRQWQALTEKRLAGLMADQGVGQAQVRTMASLTQRTDLKMDEVSLENVLKYLSESMKVPIVVDPHTSDETGKDISAQSVTIDVKGLTLESILTMILPSEYGWRTEDDRIIVSSREKANPLKTLGYPIQHLVAEIPDFGSSVPRFSLSNAMNQGGTGGSGGLWEPAPATEEPKTAPEKRIIELIKKFVTAGDPRVAAWDDLGGPATVEYFNGTLMVSQTETGHRKVIELLNRF